MAKHSLVFETTFGSYTALETIGEGGGGRVFKVTDEDGNTFAVKLLAS